AFDLGGAVEAADEGGDGLGAELLELALGLAGRLAGQPAEVGLDEAVDDLVELTFLLVGQLRQAARERVGAGRRVRGGLGGQQGRECESADGCGHGFPRIFPRESLTAEPGGRNGRMRRERVKRGKGVSVAPARACSRIAGSSRRTRSPGATVAW